MAHYGVAEAKNKFTHLLERVEDGERIIITRHGKVIAEIVKAAPEPRRRPAPPEEIDRLLEDLRTMRESLPPADGPSVDLIREMRDEGP
ncbi:MAG: type II toxin-antitoxin system prevent-host-death family antitoxin [Brevundimonas sp.]|jgi:prevent-host-death family protein|nr:type II toxin-antitoxin system prevent-host-death family antitoxin [Brevundimonas sp.]